MHFLTHLRTALWPTCPPRASAWRTSWRSCCHSSGRRPSGNSRLISASSSLLWVRIATILWAHRLLEKTQLSRLSQLHQGPRVPRGEELHETLAICFSSATRLFPSKKGVSTRNIGNIAQWCWLLGLPGYPTLEILQPWLLQSFWSAGRSCKHLRTEGWTCAPTWTKSHMMPANISCEVFSNVNVQRS